MRKIIIHFTLFLSLLFSHPFKAHPEEVNYVFKHDPERHHYRERSEIHTVYSENGDSTIDELIAYIDQDSTSGGRSDGDYEEVNISPNRPYVQDSIDRLLKTVQVDRTPSYHYEDDYYDPHFTPPPRDDVQYIIVKPRPDMTNIRILSPYFRDAGQDIRRYRIIRPSFRRSRIYFKRGFREFSLPEESMSRFRDKSVFVRMEEVYPYGNYDIAQFILVDQNGIARYVHGIYLGNQLKALY